MGEVIDAAEAARKWIGLSPKQEARLLIVLLGAIMALHIAWACGFLAFIGFNGFVKADEFKDVKHVVAVSATINLAREIRDQVKARCSADPKYQASLTDGIERMQSEYFSITGQRYPEPQCN